MSTISVGRPRGSYAKSAGRRREILRAGLDVFAAHGYRSSSIREIAARVGMSQAGVLHYFSSKAELLYAVLELRDDRNHDRMDFSTDRVGIDTLRSLIELAASNQRSRGLVELHCVLAAEATSPDHPAHEYFIKRYERVVGYTTASLEAMAERGQLKPGVLPAAAARNLIALMDGLQVQWLLTDEGFDMTEPLKTYIQPLLTIDL
jgi:AcrR family transcriptional regulator